MSPNKVILIMMSMIFLFAGCQPSEEVQPVFVEPGLSAVDSLDQIRTLYSEPKLFSLDHPECGEFVGDGTIDVSAGPSGVFASCKIPLVSQSGIVFEFTFTEDMEAATAFQWVFSSSDNLEFTLDLTGISAEMQGQPYAVYPFSLEQTWQAGQSYTALIRRTADGFIEATIWETGKPHTAASVTTAAMEGKAAFPPETSTELFTMSIWLPGEQELVLSNLWLIDGTGQGPELAAETDLEPLEEELAADDRMYIENLDGYNVQSVLPITALVCDEHIPYEILADGYRFAAEGDYYFGYCDVQIEQGQALRFTYIPEFSEDVNDSMITWVLSSIDGSPESLGMNQLTYNANFQVMDLRQNNEIALFGDFEEAPAPVSGEAYTVTMLLEKSGDFRGFLYVADEPEIIYEMEFSADEIEAAFGASTEAYDWMLGLGLKKGQSAIMSDIMIMDIEEAAAEETVTQTEETNAQTDPDLEEPTGVVEVDPELELKLGRLMSDYLIENVISFDAPLACSNAMLGDPGETYWEAQSEHLSTDCELTVQNGQAMVTDFFFDEDFNLDERNIVWNFVDSSDDAVKEIGINLGAQRISVKYKGELVADYAFDREINWTLGEKYSFVFINHKYIKQFLIWNVKLPDEMITVDLPLEELEQVFEGSLEDAKWQFGIWVMSGQIAVVENVKVMDVQ